MADGKWLIVHGAAVCAFLFSVASCASPTTVASPTATLPVITAIVVATPEATSTPTSTLTLTLTLTPTLTLTRAPSPRPRATATATLTRAPIAPLAWDARLDALGIKHVPVNASAGQAYWRLIRADFWDEKENQGKHHIYVNVLDESGARVIGQAILIEWDPGERVALVTENKPEPEFSANFPLEVNHYPPWHTLGAFGVSVEGLPSDKITGMGLPPKNRFVVYWLTFQRTTAR